MSPSIREHPCSYIRAETSTHPQGIVGILAYNTSFLPPQQGRSASLWAVMLIRFSYDSHTNQILTSKPINANKNEQRMNDGKKSPYIIAQRDASSRTSDPDQMSTVRNMFDYTHFVLHTRRLDDTKGKVPLNAYKQVSHQHAATTPIVMLVGRDVSLYSSTTTL